MNPDPLKISSIITADTASNDTIVAEETASAPVSPVQTVDIMQRQQYAQFVRDSMSSYVKGIKATKPAAEEEPFVAESPVVETPVAVVKQEVDEEAPVPHSFSDREQFYAKLATMGRTKNGALASLRSVCSPAFTVCCNECDATIPGAHWHCSICEEGDYDLCRDCVTAGVHCGVEGHFLIKRSIEDGKVISSTTEVIAPKTDVETEKEVPGAFTTEVKEERLPEMLEMGRTCNSCVNGKFCQ